MLQRLRIPHTYCWSPALIAKPKDWGPHISISGFYFLKSSNYTPASDLQTFLDTGPAPVYIGFGSIVLDDPNAMTELIFEAVKKTGQRVLLSKGWGGMGADELQIPDNVFMLGNVPHDWLFKHVSCVVHHGGAGTTAAGITAGKFPMLNVLLRQMLTLYLHHSGRPTLVVPFFGDQPFWGAMVARAGAGPEPIPHKQLTADKLADAINFCLKPESLDRAKALASKIAAERGSDMGAQSFHQYLEADRLRCTLAPARVATWRIKRTQVRLSAFAACTLANANLLDFHDLKLFRAQEYDTDEGPWDPISGGFTAACRAFSNMGMGLAEFPSETVKAFHFPSGPSRQQSQTSLPTNTRESKTSSIPPEQGQTSLNMQGSLARVRSPDQLSDPPSPASNIGSSFTCDAQDQSSFKRHGASLSKSLTRNDSGSSKDKDMLRQTGAHSSKGIGRFAKGLVQGPVDISVNLTRGMHNIPKLWGDDTVRPQERVRDFRSGVKAVGREFGFGWYDGITGLVTQPWKGAQEEGASGFAKGVGKGIGGFLTKPGAAMLGILSHTMQGVNKEVQKLFGSNVQNYIVTSRVAQGYDEWLQSSDAEKEDVIARWNLIQKHLKKKRGTEEMVRDVLEAQRKKNIEDRETRRNSGRNASPALSANIADAPTQDLESAMHGSQSPLRTTNTNTEGSLGEAEVTETIRLLVEETSRGDAEEDADVERAIQESVCQLQRQRHEAAGQEDLQRAIASSEAEAQRHASEALEYEKELKRVMAQSLREQRQKGNVSEWELDMAVNDDVERARGKEKVEAIGSPGIQRTPLYDPGHLAGTTQSEFEAQQQAQQGEKTTQEKTEEEIVMEYVKKQSLLEAHHQNKGKGRAAAMEDKDCEEL